MTEVLETLQQPANSKQLRRLRDEHQSLGKRKVSELLALMLKHPLEKFGFGPGDLEEVTRQVSGLAAHDEAIAASVRQIRASRGTPARARGVQRRPSTQATKQATGRTGAQASQGRGGLAGAASQYGAEKRWPRAHASQRTMVIIAPQNTQTSYGPEKTGPGCGGIRIAARFSTRVRAARVMLGKPVGTGASLVSVAPPGAESGATEE